MYTLLRSHPFTSVVVSVIAAVALLITGVAAALAGAGSADAGSQTQTHRADTQRAAATSPPAEGSVGKSTFPPQCSLGKVPLIDLARYPKQTSGGAFSPRAALREFRNLAASTRVRTKPLVAHPKSPVWVVANGNLYQATPLTDGTWFISPADFIRCVTPQEVGIATPGESATSNR